MEFSIGRSAFLKKFSLCLCLCFSTSLLIATDNPQAKVTTPPAQASDEQTKVTIPGPLRPFLRMAAISQQVAPDEVLPLLARNIVIDGYRGSPDIDPKPTEFLVLLKRYLQQAKELQSLAGPEEDLRVNNCHEADPLLGIIGYRLKQGCGPDGELVRTDPVCIFISNITGRTGVYLML